MRIFTATNREKTKRPKAMKNRTKLTTPDQVCNCWNEARYTGKMTCPICGKLLPRYARYLMTETEVKNAIRNHPRYDVNFLNDLANRSDISLATINFWWNAIHN